MADMRVGGGIGAGKPREGGGGGTESSSDGGEIGEIRFSVRTQSPTQVLRSLTTDGRHALLLAIN